MIGIRNKIKSERIPSFVPEAAQLAGDHVLYPLLIGLRGHWDQNKLKKAFQRTAKIS